MDPMTMMGAMTSAGGIVSGIGGIAKVAGSFIGRKKDTTTGVINGSFDYEISFLKKDHVIIKDNMTGLYHSKPISED